MGQLTVVKLLRWPDGYLQRNAIFLDGSRSLGWLCKAWLCDWVSYPVGCSRGEELILATKTQTEFRELISGSATLTSLCSRANYFVSVKSSSHLKTCATGPWQSIEVRREKKKEESKRQGEREGGKKGETKRAGGKERKEKRIEKDEREGAGGRERERERERGRWYGNRHRW